MILVMIYQNMTHKKFLIYTSNTHATTRRRKMSNWLYVNKILCSKSFKPAINRSLRILSNVSFNVVSIISLVWPHIYSGLGPTPIPWTTNDWQLLPSCMDLKVNSNCSFCLFNSLSSYCCFSVSNSLIS